MANSTADIIFIPDPENPGKVKLTTATAYKKWAKVAHGNITHKIINKNTVKELIRKDPIYNAIHKLLTEFITKESQNHYGRFIPVLLLKSGIKI